MERVIKFHNKMLFTMSCRKMHVCARKAILCKHAIRQFMCTLFVQLNQSPILEGVYMK
jgi:hypothetical protein